MCTEICIGFLFNVLHFIAWFFRRNAYLFPHDCCTADTTCWVTALSSVIIGLIYAPISNEITRALIKAYTTPCLCRSRSAQRCFFMRDFFPPYSLLSWVIYNSLHTHECCFWSFQFAVQPFLSSFRTLCEHRIILFTSTLRKMSRW